MSASDDLLSDEELEFYLDMASNECERWIEAVAVRPLSLELKRYQRARADEPLLIAALRTGTHLRCLVHALLPERFREFDLSSTSIENQQFNPEIMENSQEPEERFDRSAIEEWVSEFLYICWRELNFTPEELFRPTDLAIDRCSPTGQEPDSDSTPIDNGAVEQQQTNDSLRRVIVNVDRLATELEIHVGYVNGAKFDHESAYPLIQYHRTLHRLGRETVLNPAELRLNNNNIQEEILTTTESLVTNPAGHSLIRRLMDPVATEKVHKYLAELALETDQLSESSDYGEYSTSDRSSASPMGLEEHHHQLHTVTTIQHSNQQVVLGPTQGSAASLNAQRQNVFPTRFVKKDATDPCHDPKQFTGGTENKHAQTLADQAREQIRLAEEMKVLKEELMKIRQHDVDEEEWQGDLDAWLSKRRKTPTASVDHDATPPSYQRPQPPATVIIPPKQRMGYDTLDRIPPAVQNNNGQQQQHRSIRDAFDMQTEKPYSPQPPTPTQHQQQQHRTSSVPTSFRQFQARPPNSMALLSTNTNGTLDKPFTKHRPVLEDSGHFGGPDSDELSDERSHSRHSSDCSNGGEQQSTPTSVPNHNEPSTPTQHSTGFGSVPGPDRLNKQTISMSNTKFESQRRFATPIRTQHTMSEETVDSGLGTNRDSLSSNVGNGVAQQLKREKSECNDQPPPPPQCPPPESPPLTNGLNNQAETKSTTEHQHQRQQQQQTGAIKQTQSSTTKVEICTTTETTTRSYSTERKQWSYQQKNDAKKVNAEYLTISMQLRPNNTDTGFGFTVNGGKGKREPVTVTSVVVGTPADKAQLQINDEVIEINGENVQEKYLAKINHIIHEATRLGLIELHVKRIHSGETPRATALNAKPMQHQRSPSPGPISPPISVEFDSKRQLFDRTPKPDDYQQFRAARRAQTRDRPNWQTAAMHNPGAGRPPDRPMAGSSEHQRTHQSAPVVVNRSSMVDADPILQQKPGRIVDFIPDAERDASRIAASRRLPPDVDYRVSSWQPGDRPIGRLTDFVPESERSSVNGSSSKAPSECESRSQRGSTRDSSPDAYTRRHQQTSTTLLRNYDMGLHHASDGMASSASPQSSVASLDSRGRHSDIVDKNLISPMARSLNKYDDGNTAVPDQAQTADGKPSILQNKEVARERYQVIKQQANPRPLSAERQRQPQPIINQSVISRTDQSIITDAIANQQKKASGAVGAPEAPYGHVQKQINFSQEAIPGIKQQRDNQPTELRLLNMAANQSMSNQLTNRSDTNDHWMVEQHQRLSEQSTAVVGNNQTFAKSVTDRGRSRSPPAYTDAVRRRSSSRGGSVKSANQYVNQSLTNHDNNQQRYKIENEQRPTDNEQHQTNEMMTSDADGEPMLSVSGKQKCSHCQRELGRGAAMIIESLSLFYHLSCFRCYVCGEQLGNGVTGADVRVRAGKLHCSACYSNDEAGWKYSEV